MCFFGKQKFVAAIACLKRALYLDPFQWIVAFNLGLVSLTTKQYASAYHFFSVAVNLKPDFSNTYMYLGVTLNRLGDFDSSCQAFERAIELEKNDCTVYLNYAIVLYNNGRKDEAKAQFLNSEENFAKVDEEDREQDLVD